MISLADEALARCERALANLNRVYDEDRARREAGESAWTRYRDVEAADAEYLAAWEAYRDLPSAPAPRDATQTT